MAKHGWKTGNPLSHECMKIYERPTDDVKDVLAHYASMKAKAKARRSTKGLAGTGILKEGRMCQLSFQDLAARTRGLP